jgi:hypothetical protein
MKAKEFLESQGIDLNKTALFVVIDGYARQPDLCVLLDTFLEVNKPKVNYEDRREPFNANV